MTDERFYSVTTVIKGGVPNDALMYWAVNQTADYAVNEREGWVPLAELNPDAAKRLLKGSRFEKSGSAAARGTDLHGFAEAWVKGAPLPDLDDNLTRYADQFKRFLDDFTPEYEMVEASVYNRTYNYAGTLDAIATIGGVRFVLDYKTTDRPPTAKTRPPYADVALQLAAYAHAEWVGLTPTRRDDGRGQRFYKWSDDIDQGAPMIPVEAGGVIVISPYDYRLVTVRINPFEDDQGGTHDAWKAFLYAREVFRWNNATSKLVLGDVLKPEEAVA